MLSVTAEVSNNNNNLYLLTLKQEQQEKEIIITILITDNQVTSFLDDRILSRKLFNNEI